MKSVASSVLFAVMVTDGGGAMVDTLEHAVPQKAGLLSLGVIDKAGGVSAFALGRDVPSRTASFACLKDEAPAPFKQEVDAGSGRHIPHKFVCAISTARSRWSSAARPTCRVAARNRTATA
ncbi:hypothetical protein [Ralstonia solanacearum]|uniref:hypothetical protein n=1 Tax=Ralstonia solanacearum TaxID=305 RepID=UPI001E461C9C|nr:hypothetical protein [Ralstonia solanacearum]